MRQALDAEKKELLDDLYRTMDDHSDRSTSALVRKALRLAAICDDSTYEMLFELELLGLDTWVKSGNRDMWARRSIDDADYVAQANAIDRAYLNGNVDTRTLDTIERFYGLCLQVEQEFAKIDKHDDENMRHKLETEGILGRIRSRVALFAAKVQRSISASKSPLSRGGHKIFIGHGRSVVWRDLADFLESRLSLEWDEFSREPTAGVSVTDRLQQMLDNACFAFLIMTAEDAQMDGTARARQNVVHEAGLFQGRLGFRRAVLLLEEGCAEFSNVLGLGQIRFPRGNLLSRSEEIRRVLEREQLLNRMRA